MPSWHVQFHPSISVSLTQAARRGPVVAVLSSRPLRSDPVARCGPVLFSPPLPHRRCSAIVAAVAASSCGPVGPSRQPWSDPAVVAALLSQSPPVPLSLQTRVRSPPGGSSSSVAVCGKGGRRVLLNLLCVASWRIEEERHSMLLRGEQRNSRIDRLRYSLVMC